MNLPKVENFNLRCNQVLLHLIQVSTGLSAPEVLGRLREMGMPLLIRIQEMNKSYYGNSHYQAPFTNTQIQLKFVMNASRRDKDSDVWNANLEVKLPSKTVFFTGKQLDGIIMESVVLGNDFEIAHKVGKSKMAKRLMDEMGVV